MADIFKIISEATRQCQLSVTQLKASVFENFSGLGSEKSVLFAQSFLKILWKKSN